MATLTTQTIQPSGLGPTYAAATGGGDVMACGERMFLHVKNAGGSPVTVTLDDVGTPVPGGSAANNDAVVTVPATTGDRMIGPITPTRFARASDGLCAISYSGVTSVTVAAIQGP